jgi:hypothetical protein
VTATLLDILKDPVPLQQGDRFDKLIAYIDSCIDRHGGLQLWNEAFALGAKWYAANLYATRHGICAVKLLEGHFPGAERILDRAQINELLRSAAHGSENGCIYRGYPPDTNAVGAIVGKLWRRALDILLMPRNPLKYPQISFTPVPYYPAVFLSILTLLLIWVGYRYFLTMPQLWLLAVGPLAVLIRACGRIIHWSFWAR